MSKKLLMNNYVSNGLMPVMDGLICWLDARDYDGTNVLRDRSGNGNDFIINGAITLENDFLKMISNKQNYLYNDQLPLDWNSTTVQMRVANVVATDCYVFSSGGWNGFNLRYGQIGKTMLLNKYAGRWYIRTGNWDLSTSDVTITTYLNAENLFLRGDGINDIISTTDKFESSISSNISIGTTSGERGRYLVNMLFGSILIYNRILTEEEMQRNEKYLKSIRRG